jgi:short-subunit dehydrogenase
MANSTAQLTVLITGASSGIGRELASGYLQQGAKVFVLARSLDQLMQLVERYPSTCVALKVDLTNQQACENAGKIISAQTAHLDIAILNAGTCEYIDVTDFSIAPFDKVMAINWRGTLNSLQFCLPLLRQRKGAQLVGVSSMATLLPMPRAQAYGASKAALEYLLNSLRVDLEKDSIDISIVRPGFVRTPLTARNDFAMPFMIECDIAARKIMQGIKQRKWIIAFPWSLVWLMRFIALLPLFLQVYLLRKISRSAS